MKLFKEFLAEISYLLPAVKVDSKIYTGESGESHDVTAARHGLDALSITKRKISGFNDDRGRFYSDNDRDRERAFVYAKTNGLLHKRYEKLDDGPLHATMLASKTQFSEADSDGEDLLDQAAKTKKKLKEPKNIETNGG